jgi:hypothetical protein
MRWICLLVVLGAAVAGCGDEPERPAATKAEQAEALHQYRRAHAEYDQARDRWRGPAEPPADARARKAAHACMDAWKDAFETPVNQELLTYWEVATTREAFRRSRPATLAWVRRLRAILHLDATGDLGARRRVIESDLRRLTELYSRPIAPCAAVREWRSRRWSTPVPDDIARVLRLAEPAPRPAAWFTGFGRPGHQGYCDEVFFELSPDDSFCG